MSMAMTGSSVAPRASPLRSVSQQTADAQTIYLYPRGAYAFELSAWQTKLIVFAPIVCATLLSKFALPPLSYLGINLLYPVTLALMAYGFLTGQLQFESRRLTLLFIMLGTLGLMQLMRTGPFSMPSFLMMSALATMFVFTTTSSAVTSDTAYRFFCNLSALIALFGVMQFFVQYAGNPALTFPIETFVPEAFRTAGYNNLNPLYYGSPLYKSTGIVMLEPSVFSQLCAIGLMAELHGRARVLRLAVYVVGLIVAYSGTGLMILAVALPAFVIMYRRWDVLVRGALLAAIVVLLAEPLNLDLFAGRFDEFGRAGSSGFARFVGWQHLFSDKLWPSTTAALFGHGAGSFNAHAVGYAAAQMAHTKILFEFGVLGALVYFSFILFCIYANGAPRILKIAITACYFMNGAYSPTMTGLALSLLLWPSSKVDAPKEPRHAA